MSYLHTAGWFEETQARMEAELEARLRAGEPEGFWSAAVRRAMLAAEIANNNAILAGKAGDSVAAAKANAEAEAAVARAEEELRRARERPNSDNIILAAVVLGGLYLLTRQGK